MADQESRILLSPAIREHWIWDSAEHLKWWIDLLMLAELKDTKRLVFGELYPLKRGDLIASVGQLCERWRYRKDAENPKSEWVEPSRKRVRNFLRLLESDGKIERKTNILPKKLSVITICGFDDYQQYPQEVVPYADPYADPYPVPHPVPHPDPYAKPVSEAPVVEIIDDSVVVEAENIPTTPKSAAKKFTPPTVEEVRDYIAEKGYHVDPKAFVAYYESNGWMVGRNKMKKWQQALVTWEKRHRPANRQATSYNNPTSLSPNAQYLNNADAVREQRMAEYAQYFQSLADSSSR